MSLLGPNRRTEGTRKNPVWRPHGFGRDALRPKMLASPFKQQDGTLHPRIFRGHTHAPSEMTMPAPLSPMLTIVSSPKNAFLDTHVMAVVTVRREVEDSPGTFISAMGAVFAATSIYNMTRVTYEKEAMPLFQLKAMVEAISAAYNAVAFLKAAGCQRLVITIDRDMEWIPRVMCRYYDMLERSDEDQTLLHQFLRYPEQTRRLMEFIDSFEVITNIKLQFWPTERQEVSGAYLWANTAIDQAISNYERDYYGVFDDSDCDDYYEDEEEFDDSATVSDEEDLEEPEEPEETIIQGTVVNPQIATETLADTLGPIDLNVEEGMIIPIPAEKMSSMKNPETILSPSDVTGFILPFDRMVDVSEIDCSPFPGNDGKFAYILAQVSFGSTSFEEILLAPPFLESSDTAPPNPEATRLVTH